MASNDQNGESAEMSELRAFLSEHTWLEDHMKMEEERLRNTKPYDDQQPQNGQHGREEPKKKKSTGAYDVQVKNFAWDQSDKYVKIYLTGLAGALAVGEEGLMTDFKEDSVAVKLMNLAGKNHCFSIKKTSEKIDPQKSYAKLKTDSVSVFLAKSPQGQKWEHLRAVEKKAAEEKKKPPAVTNPDADPSDPSAGLMSMMKQMYEDGDDEMKRTIAKAWTESRNKAPGDMGGMDL